MNKRDFLKGMLATSGVSILPAFASMSLDGAAAKTLNHGQISRVVYDSRFASARSFANNLESQGATAYTPDATMDMMHLWYGKLRDSLRQGEDQVAGLTTGTDFHLVEGIAREFGMSVVYSGIHAAEGEHGMQHELRLKRVSPSAFERLSLSADWPSDLAQALQYSSQITQRPETVRNSTHSISSVGRANESTTLVSWLVV